MRAVLLLLALCVLLAAPVCALDVVSEQACALGADELEDALPEEAGEVLSELSVRGALEPESALRRLAETARTTLLGQLRRAGKSAAALLAIAVLCAVGESVAEGQTAEYIGIGGALGVCAAAAGDVTSFIGLGTETLQKLSEFSKALLPCLAAATAAAGAPGAGAARYAASAMFFDLLLTLSGSVVMPVVYAYIAVCAAKAALGGDSLAGAASLLKWLAGSLVTAIMLAFTLYLGVTGVVSGAADAAKTKLAKTAISAALPVVGGIVSDAASAVVSGANILRAAVGSFGLLAVAAVCLAPFLTLAAQYLAYKAAAGLSAVTAGRRLSCLIGELGAAFGLVLGLVGAGALMLFFSLVSGIRAVSGF